MSSPGSHPRADVHRLCLFSAGGERVATGERCPDVSTAVPRILQDGLSIPDFETGVVESTVSPTTQPPVLSPLNFGRRDVSLVPW